MTKKEHIEMIGVCGELEAITASLELLAAYVKEHVGFGNETVSVADMIVKDLYKQALAVNGVREKILKAGR